MKRRVLCLITAAVLLAGMIVLPAAAESVLDVYAKGNFGNKVKYPVYSGPGEEYVRANNGKATYSGGVCRIFGVTGDWIMIGYGLSSEQYRIGYISAEALGSLYNLKGEINYNLTFQPYTAYADDYCRLTDDPVLSGKLVYTIPEGTPVTVLCTYKKARTYVEVETPKGPMRGFVWSNHLLTYGDWPVTTSRPTARPTAKPTAKPTARPTAKPTAKPTPRPTYSYPTQTPINTTPNIYYHPTTYSIWLPTAQTVPMQGSWPVYSGPGTYYYRANNNKATMGGGNCQIYGVEGNWVLIGYSLSNGNYRIGFVSLEALPQMGLRIPYLDFQASTRRLAFTAELTDDPVRYRTSVASLAAGTYVLLLGYVWENNESWAYVEVLAGGSIMRGFLPSRYLQ